jgi:predicted nucleic-acid-binding protein
MAALDTNVLVRFLVQDDPVQLAIVRRLFERSAHAQEAVFVPVTVALELEWVLRSNFKRPKDEVIDVLSRLLAVTELSFESEFAIEVALDAYHGSSADFSDCLHVQLARLAGHAPLWTFDAKASKVAGAAQLTAATVAD